MFDGVYSCLSCSNTRKITNMKVLRLIELSLFITITVQSSNAEIKSATLGEDVQLSCHLPVNYDQIYMLMWSKDGTLLVTWFSAKNDLLERFPSKYKLTEQTKLIILDISASDRGSYLCEISTTDRVLRGDPIQLTVTAPASSVISYSKVGDNVTFESSINQNADLKELTWMKYSEDIISYKLARSGNSRENATHGKYLIRGNTSLIIVNLNVEDAGDYSCKASYSADITVNGNVNRLFIPTIQIENCMDYFGMHEGDDCDCYINGTAHERLICHAFGFPHPPSITWTNGTGDGSSLTEVTWSSSQDIELLTENSTFTCHANINTPKSFSESRSACVFYSDHIDTQTLAYNAWPIVISVLTQWVIFTTAILIYWKRVSLRNYVSRAQRRWSTTTKMYGITSTAAIDDEHQLQNVDEGIQLDPENTLCNEEINEEGDYKNLPNGDEMDAYQRSWKGHLMRDIFDNSLGKVFNDPVHGSIAVPLYCQWIIDTPQFQRLRYIKQLGCTSFVYPSAGHTLFDHAIGSVHMARKLATTLQQNDRSIKANEIACVEIAALCSNLGRGPFLSSFEDILPPSENRIKRTAVMIFEHLIEKNQLKKKLQTFAIGEPELQFISELILGQGIQLDRKLIREKKYFLYQIVNNGVNKLDVVRLDSIVRDSLFLGIQSAVDVHRIISFVRVCDIHSQDGDVRRELCFRDKVASELNKMFLMRRHLHYVAYQHRVTGSITRMLKDVFLLADAYLKVIGTNGREFNLLESVTDPEAFCQVDDTILNEVMRNRCQEEGMIKAREIVVRIHERQVYKCIVEIKHATKILNTTDPETIRRCAVTEEDELETSTENKMWYPQNFDVEVSSHNYGNGKENPLLHIPFYKKSIDGRIKPKYLSQHEIPTDSPQRLQDVTVRIYSKLPNLTRSDIERARANFNKRCSALFLRVESIDTNLRQRKKAQTECEVDDKEEIDII